MAKDTEQKKPNLFLRILILAMTAALMLGALFLSKADISAAEW